MHCNICNNDKFEDFNGRRSIRCTKCQSLERARCMHLVLFDGGIIKPGQKIFHLAPETGLSRKIKNLVGEGYGVYDRDPSYYPEELAVTKFDLTNESAQLPRSTYDVIIHSHVIEHVECNWTATLIHLHRALKASGKHVICLPIMPGRYAEDLGPLWSKQRAERFGQYDHVRKFGIDDFHLTFGQVFNLPKNWDLTINHSPEKLREYNIPASTWRGFTSNTVFVFDKSDLLLM